MSVSNGTNEKEGKNADYCRAYQKKKAEEYGRKDRARKQFQRDYRKYVSDPTKYEEFKRQNALPNSKFNLCIAAPRNKSGRPNKH